MSLERDLMDLEESLMRNDDCVHQSDYYTIVGLANDAREIEQLVRDMYKAAHMLCEAWEGSCSKEAEGMSLHEVCPIGDTSELCVFGRLDERMHDLGIEVES